MDDYPVPSKDEILRSINILFDPTDVIELRAIGGDRTEFGYFDPAHREQLALAAVSANRQRASIYFPINPILNDLLARSANRMRRAGRRDAATGDTGIRRRRWLPIDIDPERPSGISSTDEEKAAATSVARSIIGALRDVGWPDPVVGDSGNGIHVLYRIDLPANDESRDLIREVLASLAKRFNQAGAKIDETVFNASRIWKTYGTVACKGDPMPDRPHRMAAILQAPKHAETVSLAMLNALIEKRNNSETRTKHNGANHAPSSFRSINQIAMDNMRNWVPALFPMAKPYHNGYRVAASDLDRGLEEDLSLLPSGIMDFGTRDGLTPIDTVMQFGGAASALDAAKWLASKLGVQWQERKQAGDNSTDRREERKTAERDKAPVVELYPIEKFLEKQRPADWIVDGILQRGYLYSCCAPTNHGKTAVQLVLHLCIAAGKQFCGIPVQRGRVGILCGENPDGFRVRLRATMRALEITDADLAGWLYIYDEAGPLGELVGDIADSIERIGAFAAILIDTSIAYFGGDKEDDNVQALSHARLMRRLTEARGRPAVTANTHPTKSVLDRDGCVPRGGSAFLNEIDSNFSVWFDGGTAEFHWTRKKRGPDFEPIFFEFVPTKMTDCGIEVETVFASWIDQRRQSSLRRELNNRETALMRAMLQNPNYTIEQWAQIAGIVGSNGAPLRGSAVRILHRLMSFGLVAKNRYGYALTAKGKSDI